MANIVDINGDPVMSQALRDGKMLDVLNKLTEKSKQQTTRIVELYNQIDYAYAELTALHKEIEQTQTDIAFLTKKFK